MRQDSDRRPRTDRVSTARVLVEATELSFADVAFAVGFTDTGELDDALRQAGQRPPELLRSHAATRPAPAGPVSVSLRLPVHPPFAYPGVFGHLAACAVPGCEEIRDGSYRRTLRLAHGTGTVGLAPHPDHVECTLDLDDARDLPTAIARCRRLLDLDTDPQPMIETLAADPDLAAAVRSAPGQRIPGTVDECELAIRVVLSQQVSLKAAATHAARLVAAYGQPVHDRAGGLTHTFPSVEQLADLDPDRLALPRSRRTTVTTLIARLADGTLTLATGCDWQRARHQLLALPGIGPWTVEIIAMRGLGDPDAFPATDLGLRAAAAELGLPTGARELTDRSRNWRPWRSYATQQLWATLNHAVNRWPPKENT